MLSELLFRSRCLELKWLHQGLISGDSSGIYEQSRQAAFALPIISLPLKDLFLKNILTELLVSAYNNI
jgi:hypothetical protein